MRMISRTAMLDHFSGTAMAQCRAQMVHVALMRTVTAARLSGDPTDRRRAASMLLRAMIGVADPAERDVDRVVRDMFGTGPTAKLAAQEGRG